MLVVKCDICGTEIKEDSPVRKIKEYDICENCYDKLKLFMDAFKEDSFVKIVHIDEEVV